MELREVRAAVERLPEGSPQRREAEELLAQFVAKHEANPLERFHACPEYCGMPGCEPPKDRNPKGGRPKQHEFMAAREFIVASNAGNRFGKTTGMVVWAIVQHTPEHLLPKRLRVFKRAKSRVVQGRYMVPSEEFLEENVLPVFKQWCPTQILRGMSWEKAYRKHPGNAITFADGGKVAFPTYKQDAAMLAGWSGDYVLWDEPPPESHWREGGPVRVLDRDGCHRFGMTPVNMKGGGIGWVKRRIFDRAKPTHPEYKPNHIHVVRASIWDNPQYSAEQIEKILAEYPEEERQAREHGAFLHFGGMIYPEWERYLVDPPEVERIRGKDIIVGIDPGYRVAAFVYVAFDEDNSGLVFDAGYIEKGKSPDYAGKIRHMNAKWGIKDPTYVMDPYHGHKHSQTDGQTMQDELGRQGIWTINPAVLDKDAIVYGGVAQIWRRMAEGAFAVSRACGRLTSEAEEYRLEEGHDFKPVKENDHGMDAMRYAFTLRPWYVDPIENLKEERWHPGWAPPAEWLEDQAAVLMDGPPMGSLS